MYYSFAYISNPAYLRVHDNYCLKQGFLRYATEGCVDMLLAAEKPDNITFAAVNGKLCC